MSINLNNLSINIISFPRSGQHLLQSILEYILVNHNKPYSFCEYYTCCKTTPCKKNSIFQKNHDFYNTYTILPNNKYIVLYRRDKILQLESYYRFIINKNHKEYNDMDLVKFINKQSTYYDNFINKWVNKENILSIEYYELIQNPKESIEKIFAYTYPTLILNKDIIENIAEIDFSINNKSCIYNNTSSKIIVKNNMDSIKYKYIKDIIYSTNS